MVHPYADLLRDRHVRVLWAGLALSALGGEFYRVGAIWLATEAAGANAALLVTAQSAAILAVSLLGGPVAERFPRGPFLIATDLASAVACLAVVAGALQGGLDFPTLVVAGVLLSAMGGMARPVFLSSLPALVGPERLRAVNGLFDSVIRIAQAAGPFLAAAALAAIPAIHLLTANALSFLVSAAAILTLGRRLEREPAAAAGASAGLLRRLARGAQAANACPGVWAALLATAVRGGAYALGFTVAVPLLFSQADGAGGLGAVAIVFGAAAATELLAGPVLVLGEPSRPLRRQFEGYVMIGLSLTLVGVAAALPPPGRLPAMVAAAALMGLGNAVAGLQMMTFFAARLPADDHAAVLRLRLVLVISAMMAASALGPLILKVLGPALTTVGCGLVAACAGVAGALTRPSRTLGPGFRPA